MPLLPHLCQDAHTRNTWDPEQQPRATSPGKVLDPEQPSRTNTVASGTHSLKGQYEHWLTTSVKTNYFKT